MEVKDKKTIRDAENMIDYHFGLGLRIRNNWYYCGERENIASLLKDLGEDIVFDEESGDLLFFGGGDNFSTVILNAYQKHLKKIA